MLIDPELSESRVLVCDDMRSQALMLKAVLKRAGIRRVDTVCDPRRVLPTLSGHRDFSLLLLDLEMPHLHGFEVMELLRSELTDEERVPVIVITGANAATARLKALEMGAADFINKPFDEDETILRVRNVLRAQDALMQQRKLNHELEQQVRERTHELERTTEAFIENLATVCEIHDREAARHCIRVGQLAGMLAELAGLPAETCFMIERAAPLHDVGNIAVPDEILLKPERLTAEEFDDMTRHTHFGRGLLGRHESKLVQTASSIAGSHHERWDGTGYPNGLRGEAIAIEGRITAICDVFDALVSHRPHKDPWSLQNAVEYLVAQSGKHFDPGLVELFVANLPRVEQIREASQAAPAMRSEPSLSTHKA